MKNIYSKLQAARCDFQAMPLKKSGFNKFANYKYFELSDFMPAINSLLDKYSLCSNVCFYSDYAELIITNAENVEEKLTFTSPFTVAEVKGCNTVQNLGAAQTYLRRYLWVNAFEIVESDGMEALTGMKEESQTKVVTAAQIGKIEMLLIELQQERKDLEKWVKTKFNCTIRQLTEEQANRVIEAMELKKQRLS